MKDRYTYQRGTDGCDNTFDVCYPDGTHLVSIHFWEQAEQAEREAKMIVTALNHHNDLIRQFRKVAFAVCDNLTFNKRVRAAVSEALDLIREIEGGAV